MLTFRPITLDDRTWMVKCRDVIENPFTALSFPALYTWREAYGLKVAGNDTAFIIHSEHDQAFFWPCGVSDACQMLIKKAEETEKPLRFLYLTRNQAELFQSSGWQIRVRPDLSEYLASAQALALRAGHASCSFKTKCRRFRKNVSYEVQTLSDEDVPWIRELTERVRLDPRGTDFGDESVMEAAFEGFSELGMQGIRMRTGDGKEAFILGYENTPGMLTMTMTRHDPALPQETTAILVHELASLLCEQYPMINLEEDLGIEGLRRAKRLYSPVDQLEVFEAVRE